MTRLLLAIAVLTGCDVAPDEPMPMSGARTDEQEQAQRVSNCYAWAAKIEHECYYEYEDYRICLENESACDWAEDTNTKQAFLSCLGANCSGPLCPNAAAEAACQLEDGDGECRYCEDIS